MRQRVEALLGRLEGEIDLIGVERRIRGRVKKQMEKSQREYYLNEQMKAIQKEMGQLGEGNNDFEELEKRIEEARACRKRLARKQMPSSTSSR